MNTVSKKTFHCAGIVFAALFCVFFLFVLFTAVHTFRAPYLLLSDPQQLGRCLGSIKIQWNGKTKSSWVYTSRMLDRNQTVPCLMIYPKFRWNPFPYHALKVTQDSIGIFNDSLTECLPMGKFIYESSMSYPVYSVNDDMKGWDAGFRIIQEKDAIRYQVFPSLYSDRNIDFTVPLSYFEKMKR